MTTLIKQPQSILESVEGDYRQLLKKVSLINTLQNKISGYLDSSMKHQIQVANLIDRALILVTPSSSVATQLRFMVPDLLRKFKQDAELTGIQSIQCKVSPKMLTPERREPPPSPVTRLSSETADIIRSTAESIEDPALRKIMMRISEHQNG
jgi:hypothetical protein